MSGLLSADRIIELALSLGVSLAGIAPEKNSSVLVLALEHKETEPELDWWEGSGGTEGNRKLIRISNELKTVLKEEFDVDALPLPYHVEKGGIYLKNAAVLAGMGVIGRNNLLITPQFGPRIRLRAVSFNTEAVDKEPLDFDPCKQCEMSCWSACPENAFKNGRYDRALCQKQMHKNEMERVFDNRNGNVVVKYCRACELSCPVGKKS